MAKMNAWEKFFVNSFIVRIPVKYILVPRMLQFVYKPLTGKALEVGTGSGVCARAFASQYQHMQIVATDVDPEQVAFAKSISYPKTVRFEVQDATNLKFTDATFDYAFSFNTMHHIKDYTAAFRELHRVLKPGAILLIEDVKPAWWHPRGFGQHAFSTESYFSFKKFEQELRVAGFMIEKKKEYLSMFCFLARKKTSKTNQRKTNQRTKRRRT